MEILSISKAKNFFLKLMVICFCNFNVAVKVSLPTIVMLRYFFVFFKCRVLFHKFPLLLCYEW